MIRIRPIAADERLRSPERVVFVLDASASMGKRRMDVIVAELEKLLTRLRPQDRFNVVGFKQNVRKFTETLAPVTDENLQSAKRFIRPLEASGKTDIYTSLEPLVRLGTERARPLILFLVSDGRPTVGVVNSRNIINNLTRYQGPSTSIFCLGTAIPSIDTCWICWLFVIGDWLPSNSNAPNCRLSRSHCLVISKIRFCCR
jgi:Mg-chelatase subunit ChlD